MGSVLGSEDSLLRLLDRRQVLLRVAALVGVTTAASACRHLVGRVAAEGDEDYGSKVTPPTPATPGAGGFCLLPGSLVIDGRYRLRLVEDIGIGETVASLDSRTGCAIKTVVTDVLHMHVRDHFYIVNGELRITNDHPVLVRTTAAPRWTRVEDLGIGDGLHSPAGQIAVRSIERIDHRAETVYLETAADSFLVLGRDGPYVVHGHYRGQRLETLARAA